MKRISAYIWMMAVLVGSQLFIDQYYLLVIIWVIAGIVTKKIGMQYVFLKAFLVELVLIGALIYINRTHYLYLEEWMTNLGQNQFLFYVALALFNALNAGFCFLLGAAFIKGGRRKKYNGPYHF